LFGPETTIEKFISDKHFGSAVNRGEKLIHAGVRTTEVQDQPLIRVSGDESPEDRTRTRINDVFGVRRCLRETR